MNRVWPAPVCGQRVCVCEGALEQPTNNWQSIKQRVGFTTLVVHACQLVPCEAAVDDGVNNCNKFLPELVKTASIDHPHRNDKMVRHRERACCVFIDEKDGKSE